MELYLSADSMLDHFDVSVEDRIYFSSLSGNETSNFSVGIGIPEMESDNFYLLAEADEQDYVSKVNEENNGSAHKIWFEHPALDFYTDDISLSADSLYQNNELEDTIFDNNDVQIQYLSDDDILDDGMDIMIDQVEAPSLDADETATLES